MGRGVILISGHFTTVEIATRILGTVAPLIFVFRPMKSELLSRTMHERVRRRGKPIAHDDIRAMICALKRNEAVWCAPDQSYRRKGAAMVEFFGVPAATTGLERRVSGLLRLRLARPRAASAVGVSRAAGYEPKLRSAPTHKAAPTTVMAPALATGSRCVHRPVEPGLLKRLRA